MWICAASRRMIDTHHDEAKRTGARIVFSCGFDSIPFDLGVLTFRRRRARKFGHPARQVKARLRKVKGGMSGGTAASAQITPVLDTPRLLAKPNRAFAACLLPVVTTIEVAGS
jgi:short subunit dehydrogenase-like uncharacterized protein